MQANQQVTSKLGAAIGAIWNGNLVVAAYDLYEFNTQPTAPIRHESGRPDLLTPPESRCRQV